MSLLHPTRNAPVLCYVTDGRALSQSAIGQLERLAAKIAAAARAGVDLVQIRERELEGAELALLARTAIANAGANCRILINDRLDVACAVRAAGVHLGERSIPVREARQYVREHGSGRLLIGASRHSVASARSAEAQGADYVIFGPVFATPSKAPFGPPQGLGRLREICHALEIPVLAVGGITERNARECYAHGAAGIAGIRLFQDAENLERVVKRLVLTD